MKQLMMVAAAALGLAAFAQEIPQCEGDRCAPPREGARRAGANARHTYARGEMPQGRGMDEAVNDPAVRAVMNPRVAQKIGLSDEVQLSIKKIDIDWRKSMKDLQQKTRAAMAKQAQLMRDDKPDEAAVMAAIDELFDLRKAMAKEQTKRVLSIKALITPEQLKAAMEELRAERAARGGNRPAPRRPEGEERDAPRPEGGAEE